MKSTCPIILVLLHSAWHKSYLIRYYMTELAKYVVCLGWYDQRNLYNLRSKVTVYNMTVMISHYCWFGWFYPQLPVMVVYGVLMAIAFMGYVLPWGLMSYWGATVITNLYTGVPCMVPWFLGGFYISNPSISRYFTIHSILRIPVSVSLVFHVLYIHRISTSNGTGYNTNNRVHFHIWLIHKDTMVIVQGILVVLVQVYHGIIMLAHPDNSIEASVIFTPLHIVPEWYYLGYYSVLKAIPGKTSGFLIMISYTLGTNIYGEPYNTSTLAGCPGYTGKYTMVFLLSVVVFYSLWIGVQLPQGIYISYGRGYIMVSIGCNIGYSPWLVPG